MEVHGDNACESKLICLALMMHSESAAALFSQYLGIASYRVNVCVFTPSSHHSLIPPENSQMSDILYPVRGAHPSIALQV
jgi:hypothetical protein